MLSQADLNALVRDEVAWRRAMAHAREDATLDPELLLSHTSKAPRGLVQRGSAENAMTLRFLASLRSVCANEALSRSNSLPSLRKEWSASTRITPDADSDHDVLRELLRRSANAKGVYQARRTLSSAWKGGRHRDVCTAGGDPAASGAPNARPRSQCDAFAAVSIIAQRLESLEQVERRQLVQQEEARRCNVMHALMQGRVSLLMTDEYCWRRALFRQAMAEKAVILETEMATFTSITGLTHVAYARLMKLHEREQVRRRVLMREQEHTRSLMEQLSRLEEVRIVEREIAMCARREQQLSLRARASTVKEI